MISSTPAPANSQDGDSREAQSSNSPSAPGSTAPFATREKQSLRNNFRQNKMAIITGGAVGAALILFVLTSIPGHQDTKKTSSLQPKTAVAPAKPSDEKSLFPVIDSGAPIAKDSSDGSIGEDDVHRTASHQPNADATLQTKKIADRSTLGALPPFDASPESWQPQPYPLGNKADEAHEGRAEDREKDQPSLVFVSKTSSTNAVAGPESHNVDVMAAGPLFPGTRLRARLETSASTAVQTPVIAVVEYNYEKGGELIVPAGSKCFGHIEQADRFGYLSIRFDSLLEPDGSLTKFDAVATDLSLRPLKGKVEGKNTGKNIAVRSLSGLGEVGSLLLGHGTSLNQPFSEGDLVRERVSTNIGTATDQELTKISVNERIVVSLPANTAIYVVLDRVAQPGGKNAHDVSARAETGSSAESLRQLLQLQRELNQTAEMNSH